MQQQLAASKHDGEPKHRKDGLPVGGMSEVRTQGFPAMTFQYVSCPTIKFFWYLVALP